PHEGLSDGSVPSLKGGSEPLATHDPSVRQQRHDLIGGIDGEVMRGRSSLDDTQMHVWLVGQFERARWRRPCRSVLDGQYVLAVAFAQIKVAVPPGMQVTRASQRLAVLSSRCTVLADMMYEHNCQVVVALQCPKFCEQGAYLPRRVF